MAQTFTTTALKSSRNNDYSLFEMVRRKEQQLEQFRNEHKDPQDDLRMLLGYFDATPDFTSSKKLANALRNPDRLSVGVDIKRRSPTSNLRVDFNDAGGVAESFVDCNADFIVANADYESYGGDTTDIEQVVTAIRKSSPETPVIFKDIIIDPLQLALAKSLKFDAALVMACVVGKDLLELLNTATLINLPVIVECHTPEEVSLAVEGGAGTILLNRVDRFGGNEFHATQPFAVRDVLPPENFVTTLVTGKVFDALESNLFLQEGFDGVLIGEGLIGNPSASSLIKEIHNLELGDEGEINRSNVF